MEPENKSVLMVEKDSHDLSFTHAMQLLLVEIEKIQKGESKQNDEENYLDLFSHKNKKLNKNKKLKERVLIPVKQYPKFNFWGRFLDHKEIQSDCRKRLGQRSLSWGRVQ